MSKSAIQIRDDFKAFLIEMAESFSESSGLRNQEIALRELHESVDKPFTLAVFGRMKTGKSSIINALVGKPLAITGVEEATATLNWISHGESIQEGTMIVHWKDGRSEPVDFTRLSEWAGKDADVLERVRNTAYLQLYANIPSLKNIQIVDTPGTGSVAVEHEGVAQKFLSPRAAEDSDDEGRKADALLYVFPPVARERDADALGHFQQTRLPGSDPYNSLGVLHKWDGLETEDGDIAGEAKRKAERLRDTLGDFMADVIPVSAPLAMVARHAPQSFLDNLLQVIEETAVSGELSKVLGRDTRWDKLDSRRLMRSSYSLPWVSFVRTINLIQQNKPRSANELRSICLDASGFLVLEKELDQRFFKRAALIKQRLTRVKCLQPIRSGLMAMNGQISNLEVDVRNFKAIKDLDLTHGATAGWVDKKLDKVKLEKETLENKAIQADEIWLNEERRIEQIENDLKFLRALDNNPNWIEDRDKECIEKILGNPEDEGDLPPQTLIKILIERYQPMLQAPLTSTRAHFEHLLMRLTQILHTL